MLAEETNSVEPSCSSLQRCVLPFPKVCVPSSLARLLSCSAPESSSLVLAVPWLTSTTCSQQQSSLAQLSAGSAAQPLLAPRESSSLARRP